VLADLVQRGKRADAQVVPVAGDAAQLVKAADVDHVVRGGDAQPEPVEQLGPPAITDVPGSASVLTAASAVPARA
jgi:hypothetical protein